MVCFRNCFTLAPVTCSSPWGSSCRSPTGVSVGAKSQHLPGLWSKMLPLHLKPAETMMPRSEVEERKETGHPKGLLSSAGQLPAWPFTQLSQQQPKHQAAPPLPSLARCSPGGPAGSDTKLSITTGKLVSGKRMNVQNKSRRSHRHLNAVPLRARHARWVESSPQAM